MFWWLGARPMFDRCIIRQCTIDSSAQSGGIRGPWILERDAPHRVYINPVTGAAASEDVASFVRLQFPTLEAAIAYSRANRMQYVIREGAAEATKAPKSYQNNFVRKRDFGDDS